jgi:hypothetical protein
MTDELNPKTEVQKPATEVESQERGVHAASSSACFGGYLNRGEVDVEAA